MNSASQGKVKDIALSMLSSVVLTSASQLIAYPFLSRILDASDYGVMLTVMGFVNTCAVALGNPLCNTRILLQDWYDRHCCTGDFFPLLSGFALLLVFTLSFVSVQLYACTDIESVSIALLGILVLFRSYAVAGYRITLDFFANLKMSICSFVGYLIGIPATLYTGLWQSLFICGEVGATLYLIKTSNVMQDSISITPNFKKMVYKTTILFSATVVMTAMTYADRFILFPFLGPEFVSLYVVASFLGKTLNIVINPISSVLIGYYAHEIGMSRGTFFRRVVALGAICFVCFAAIVLVQCPVTKLLYPSIYSAALPYLFIANLGAALLAFGNALQPMFLRYGKDYMQPLSQVMYLVLYVIFGLGGMFIGMLGGFCIGVCIANLLRAVIFLSFVWTSVSKD